MTAGGDWPCEAYGPEALQYGARCFLADLGERLCPTTDACHAVMVLERVRIFGRILELAAAGDPVGLLLAEEFTSPEQLLGGADDAKG